jgi:hypothetical protein
VIVVKLAKRKKGGTLRVCRKLNQRVRVFSIREKVELPHHVSGNIGIEG